MLASLFFLVYVPADRLVVRMLSQRSPNRLVDWIVVGSKPGPGTIHFFLHHLFNISRFPLRIDNIFIKESDDLTKIVKI